MAAFACDRCGKCCTSLGPHITIERQLNDADYYCRSAIGNEFFLARVDPAFREEISDEFAADCGRARADKPCRFLRKSPDGEGTLCLIYQTRPPVCRNFRCYRMLIRNREGTVCGKIVGKTSLRTEDAVLEKIWKEQIRTCLPADTVILSQKIDGILSRHGYFTEPVE